MKTFTLIYFKPKLEYFDEYVKAFKKISPDSYICSRDKKIIQVFVNNSIEALTDTQPEDLEWLHQHKHMLQEYSTEEVHSRPYTAFIEHEPSIPMSSIK
jgi:hypothetical protein